METAVQKTQQETLKTKREAWGNMGVAIHTKELEMQAFAQESIAKAIIPTTVEGLAQAEQDLKTLKKNIASQETERKKYTSRLDDVITRMIVPEKSMRAHADAIDKKMIELKQQAEAEKRKKEEKTQEATKIREAIEKHISAAEFDLRSKIESSVAGAHTYALGDGQIMEAELPKFLKLCENRQKPEMYTIALPSHRLVLVTAEELKEIEDSILPTVPKPEEFLTEYKEKLHKKFSDYAVALANKETALEQTKKEAQANVQKLSEQKESKDLVASLDATVVPLAVVSEVKALKKSYVVDMPETAESAMKILTAFIANYQLCASKLKVNKWNSFTVAQAANALGKVKSDDNRFDVSGITWKEEYKQ